jgi:hypothetical protein
LPFAFIGDRSHAYGVDVPFRAPEHEDWAPNALHPAIVERAENAVGALPVTAYQQACGTLLKTCEDRLYPQSLRAMRG